jgi:hypothetical protein
MTATSNTNSQEEQLFLATLQECLQADNEKRAAAEVNYINLKKETFSKILFVILANLSRYSR